MNEKKMKRHPLRWILLAVVAAAVAAGCAFSHYGGFGAGPSANAGEFARYAAPVAEVTVPAGTRVVALGEATHGNKEFQQLKLDAFKALVEKGGVRAFALEGDFGGCETVNRYIHGGEGTAEEAAAAIGMLALALQGDQELSQRTYFYMLFAILVVWVVSTVRDARRLRHVNAERDV